MLLLYPVLRLCRGPANLIYIPLCFYFIVGAAMNGIDVSSIYIPLCFYFICMLSELVRAGAINLHSTMLLLYQPPLPALYAYRCVFTFHYASTLSYNRYRLNILRYPIYIPLCFYFIKFVFRYSRGRTENLHSTMLLLYRVSKRQDRE